MRVVITEDIIRNALNESIDEFMINEDFGDAVKGAWGYAKKAGNWLKNAAAMYMDYKTNGQWNNKYGIYANGNGKTTELFYLNKWFNYHLKNIKNIGQRNNDPSGEISRSREYYVDPVTKRKIYKDTGIDYDDIGLYVGQNVTPYNFNKWVSRFIQDRMALGYIDKYLLKCNKYIKDVRTAEQYLSTAAFLADDETGQQYMKQNKSQLNSQRKQYEAGKIQKLIPNWQKSIMNSYGKNNWNNVYSSINNDKGMPNNLRKFLLSFMDYATKAQDPSILKRINYRTFLRYFGKYYQ